MFSGCERENQAESAGDRGFFVAGRGCCSALSSGRRDCGVSGERLSGDAETGEQSGGTRGRFDCFPADPPPVRRLVAVGQISAQGRITLPQMFKEHAGIENGTDAVVVGIEIGVELWSLERWEAEQRKIMEHSMKKDELEMMRDLETDRNEL